jgi:hypothetical protein
MLRCLLPAFAVLSFALRAERADAQVREVVVGITTTCPYDNAIEGNCWSGAYWTLLKVEGVADVDKAANGYNSTARVYLKDKGIPDPGKWADQFKKLVGQTYIFRGVELTVDGAITGNVDNGLTLRVPGVDHPVAIRRLEHKLQWNSRKGAPRQPEPDERDAYQQLATKLKEAKGGDFGARLTGPLVKSDEGYAMEIREFFPIERESYAPTKD